MDSTSSSSTTAAVDPAALRSFPKCRWRMSGLQFDLHTICEPCRGIVCSLDTRCLKCKPWSQEKMSAYLKDKVSLAGKRRSRKGSAPITSSPAVASSPLVDSHIRLPLVSEDSVIHDTVLSYLSSLSKSGSLGTNLPSFAAPSPVPDSAPSIKGVTGEKAALSSKIWEAQPDPLVWVQALYRLFFFFFMNGNTERAKCTLSRVCIP